MDVKRRIRRLGGDVLERASSRLLHRTVTMYPPSFRRELHRRIRLRDAGVAELSRFDAKDEVLRLAEAVGVACPRLVARAESPEELTWEQLPDRFVLKPEEGHSGRGVSLVERRAGGWVELRDGQPIAPEGAARRHRRDAAAPPDRRARTTGEARPISEAVVVEEMAPARSDGRDAGLPFEWQMYTFNGRIELITQVAADGTRRIRLYDGAWLDLGEVRADRPVDPTLPSPENPDGLLEVATDVSVEVGTPYVRVDLFDAPEILLNEVELCPGEALRFTPSLDRRLGEAWEAAMVRLLDASERPLLL